ncbi:MAG: phosphoribosylamine--glycine ligase, partial [Candidatus Eremiobacteraeota bacterium]|nr:phosphoribosylamine--glycine ligase [Candidatus Eremiobacteraeota bacterium]
MGISVLVVGNGGREDALSWRLAQSPSVERICAAPGNAGTASRGDNWEIAATDGKALVERAKREGIALAVIGPETAIAAGVSDQLRDGGILTFGPNRSGGRLESSKIFAKRFLERHAIPTAHAEVAHSLDGALKILERWNGDGIAIKADGLAAGKGVVVVDDAPSARSVLQEWYGKGRVPGGGTDLLLEERIA